jgi:hypothetical protein
MNCLYSLSQIRESCAAFTFTDVVKQCLDLGVSSSHEQIQLTHDDRELTLYKCLGLVAQILLRIDIIHNHIGFRFVEPLRDTVLLLD